MHENLFAKAGLSLERLKTFAEIVAAGGITAGARGNANRQSQFSRQLKELEEYFGTELLRRGRGKFALTPAGKQLRNLVELSFGGLSELRLQCVNQPVELRIGAGESLLQWLFLPRLERLRARLPNTKFIFQNLQTHEIIARLMDGCLDLGLIRTEVTGKSLKSVNVFAQEYRMFVQKRVLPNKLNCEEIGWLKNLTWVTLEGDGQVNRVLYEKCKQAGISLDVQVECSSYTQAAEGVRRHGLAAVLPAIARIAFDLNCVEEIQLSFLKQLTCPMVLACNARTAAVRPLLFKAMRALKQEFSSNIVSE